MGDDAALTFPKPMGPQLLVKVYDPQTGKWGRGFFGPTVKDDDQKPTPARGVVVSVGFGVMMMPGGDRVPFDVEVGDEILFWDQFGQPVEIEKEQLVLLNEGNVLVVVSRLGAEGLARLPMSEEDDTSASP